MSQLALDLLQPLQPSFDNFVPGRNVEALHALRRLADGQLADRIVFLWGSSGSGRSHLLAAMAQAPGAFQWVAAGAPEQPGIALVDNVEQLDDTAQVALFNRLNAVRAQATAACVIAGNAPPVRLTLRDDLRTRLAWGLVYHLHPLTDAEKAQALRTHAAATGLALPDDVLAYLLTHLPRDLRTLVAALDALDAHALVRKRPLTVPLLRDWLQLRLDAPGDGH